jgi:hypothetical protein
MKAQEILLEIISDDIESSNFGCDFGDFIIDQALRGKVRIGEEQT